MRRPPCAAPAAGAFDLPDLSDALALFAFDLPDLSYVLALFAFDLPDLSNALALLHLDPHHAIQAIEGLSQRSQLFVRESVATGTIQGLFDGQVL